ncbi:MULTISPECIES: pantoate--beta-alanine ligase [unclassified Ectothiorhodospira]|uniref:pantoate--beta-alanine ligase n=1 Tax=unclassified Ectothiorhodospira TaxID=2684909 RepID=UPI001EE8B9AA|nr:MULTISPECIES: pantoate--beta-alanine ligase [unclassified Ectothiorhodospira]MCG5516333.1 pantoate--beta-alanine ligase [Ectothiorhodospira sp. 9100]MCG5518395.1 pantoate--beta-alanine ligase [Ectothiorhodospira sp. 9905]
MDTIHRVTSLRDVRAGWRDAHDSVALVPTMGNLHEGHLALVRQARLQADRVVVSIFVNPLQFDRPEDLAAYPRTLAEDCELLAREGVDLVFAPGDDELYRRPRSDITRVEVPGLSDLLEGAHRPGHFAGVATVVCKLFNLVQPDLAIFGEKDFQQLMLIRRMVDDLDLPVEVLSGATVREPDGLALSSRNAYLDRPQRERAPGLYQTLSEVGRQVAEGARDYLRLEDEAMKGLEIRGFEPDYVAVRRSADLLPPGPQDSQLVVLAAAWLGRARLIDNLMMDVPTGD